MLRVEEIRCGRCRRLLDAPEAAHRCRTLDEQIDVLRARSREIGPPIGDPKDALAMRGTARQVPDRERERERRDVA